MSDFEPTPAQLSSSTVDLPTRRSILLKILTPAVAVGSVSAIIGHRIAGNQQQQKAEAVRSLVTENKTASAEEPFGVVYRNRADLDNPGDFIVYRTTKSQLPTLLETLNARKDPNNRRDFELQAFPIRDEKGALSCFAHATAVDIARSLNPSYPHEIDSISSLPVKKQAAALAEFRKAADQIENDRRRDIEVTTDYIVGFLQNGSGTRSTQSLNVSRAVDSTGFDHFRKNAERMPQAMQKPEACKVEGWADKEKARVLVK